MCGEHKIISRLTVGFIDLDQRTQIARKTQRSADNIIVRQNSHRGAIKVIVLLGLARPKERSETAQPQEQRDWYQNNQNVHGRSSVATPAKEPMSLSDGLVSWPRENLDPTNLMRTA